MDAKRVYDVCLQGRVNEVSVLLNGLAEEEKQQCLQWKDMMGKTCLHWAADRNKEDILRLLLEHGANTEVRDEEGFTPLHKAVYGGAEECTRALLDRGAAISAKSNTAETPLHRAALYGRGNTAQLLVEAGADKAARDINGMTPYDVAFRWNYTLLLPVLRPEGLPQRFDHAQLHRSCFMGHRPLVQELLAFASPDELNTLYNGTTALHVASMRGNEEIVVMLLQAGGDPNVCDASGCTVVTAAKRFNRKSVLEAMKKCGVSFDDHNARESIADAQGHDEAIRSSWTLDALSRAGLRTLDPTEVPLTPEVMHARAQFTTFYDSDAESDDMQLESNVETRGDHGEQENSVEMELWVNSGLEKGASLLASIATHDLNGVTQQELAEIASCFGLSSLAEAIQLEEVDLTTLLELDNDELKALGVTDAIERKRSQFWIRALALYARDPSLSFSTCWETLKSEVLGNFAQLSPTQLCETFKSLLEDIGGLDDETVQSLPLTMLLLDRIDHYTLALFSASDLRDWCGNTIKVSQRHQIIGKRDSMKRYPCIGAEEF